MSAKVQNVEDKTYIISATQTLPTPNLSAVLIRTVLRLSLNGTVVVLSTFMMACLVLGSTYARWSFALSEADTKL